MKKLLMSLFVALVAITFGLSAADFRQTVPVTVENGNTVGAGAGGASRAAAPAADTTQLVDISIVPSVGGPQHAGSFGVYALNAVNTIRLTDTLPVDVVGSATDAKMIEFLRPEDLMTSFTAPLYGGVFNPSTPFHNERGSTIWWWVVISSKTGGNTVSLDMINASATSTDPQGTLRKETSFASGSYSPIAIGVRADASIVVSGASSQLVKKVVVGVGSVSYPVGTVADVTSVRNYMLQFGGFATTLNVTAGASTATKTLSLVAPRPKLVAKVVNGVPGFELVNNRNPDSFQLQLADQITGPWVNHPTLVKAGDRIPATGDMKFARFKQP
jgi:hypothetical protein